MAEIAVKKKISMIPAKAQYDRDIKLTEKKLRVAAYCRVSTELEQQESSYEAQVEYYTENIEANPNWKNAGIYADDGKSATNTKKRDDFNAMIKDALDGKIDMILTRSVSRFARNTVDALMTIRKLKEKNVAVVFEKEGVNTLDGTGEILITILSSLAQEESRNISENTRWGVVRRFEKGKACFVHRHTMPGCCCVSVCRWFETKGKTLYNRFHLSWCTFTRGMEVIFELYFQRFRSSRSELPR